MFVRVMELDIMYIYIYIGKFVKLTTLQPCKSLQKACVANGLDWANLYWSKNLFVF